MNAWHWWQQVNWQHALQVGGVLFAMFCFAFSRVHGRAKYHRGYKHTRIPVRPSHDPKRPIVPVLDDRDWQRTARVNFQRARQS